MDDFGFAVSVTAENEKKKGRIFCINNHKLKTALFTAELVISL
jgi:hypothetical protein